MDTAKEAAASKQHRWEDVLWTDKTKVELVGKTMQLEVWCEKRTAYHHEDLFPKGESHDLGLAA